MNFNLDCHCKLHFIIHWEVFQSKPAKTGVAEEFQVFVQLPDEKPEDQDRLALNPSWHRLGEKSLNDVTLSVLSCICTAGGGGKMIIDIVI